MNFLHGSEIIEVQDGTRTIQEVKTAVIGLIGIAPIPFGLNTCKLITNDTQAAQYGKPLPGFDIPQSLDHIFAQGAGTVIVVNIFDPAIHTAAVAGELKVVTLGKIKLDFAPIDVPVLKTAANAATTYVSGVDYTIDEYGNFSVIAGRIPNATSIKFDYLKLNSAAITTAHVIGTTNAQGVKTGIKALDLCYNTFGFRPKILIAPGRSSIKAIAAELEISAGKLRAIALIDSTFGATIEQAIADRGDATKAFGTSSKRVTCLFPYIKAYDVNKENGLPDTNTDTDFPFSAFYAGVIAATDRTLGYYNSPSNFLIKGVTGIEREISANINDSTTDTNLLNGAGIVTVFNSFGTGWKAWGNRNASHPTNTQVDVFNSLLRTFDVVHESLEESSLQFIDRAGTQAFIDDIRNSGNAFLRRLIGRGALTVGSKVYFMKEDNPVDQIAAGQYVFRIVKMGPTPAERITYRSIIDINLLTSLK